MDMYDRIDTLLKIQKMSRRQLAEKINVPASTLASSFSRKSKSMSVDMIAAIAVALNVSLDELMGLNSIQTTIMTEHERKRQLFFKKYSTNEKSWNKILIGHNKFLDMVADIGGMTEDEFISAYNEYNEMEREFINKKFDTEIIKAAHNHKEGDSNAEKDEH